MPSPPRSFPQPLPTNNHLEQQQGMQRPDVKPGYLHLLLAGAAKSAGRPMPKGAMPGPVRWNRIHCMALAPRVMLEQ